MTRGEQNSQNGASPPGSPSVLVTGAAGFIGSHLCERLLRDGARVWGLDNFDDFYDSGMKRRNIASALKEPSMHLVEGDVRDEILLDGLMSDVDFDAVVHLAARPGAQASLENPDLCYDVNARGTLRLLEAMRRHAVRVLLFGSSSAVYGADPTLPQQEDHPADRPLSPYAASKRSAELLCHAHHHLYGLSVYCLRFFAVYGPRQRPDLAIHKFARLMADGEPIPLYGDGDSRRDYTYIDDAVDGVVLTLERALRRDSGGPEYHVLNLGRNQPVELDAMVDALGSALGVTPRTERLSTQPGDAPATCAAIDRSADMLGYSPTTGLAEGLAKFADWLRETSTGRTSAVRTRAGS